MQNDERRDWLRQLAVTLARGASDEVGQRVWLTALEQGRSGVARPAAWWRGVARNHARRVRRERLRRSARERAAAVAASSPSALAVVERDEVAGRLAAAVRSLDEPYRVVVEARFFEGLAPRSIAARLGVPVETVRTRLKRALAQLRARLDRAPGGREAWLAAVAWSARRSRVAGSARLVAASTVAGGAALAYLAGVVAAPEPQWGPAAVEKAAEAQVAAPMNAATADREPVSVRARRRAVTAHAAGVFDAGAGTGTHVTATTVLEHAAAVATAAVMRDLAVAQRAVVARTAIDEDGDRIGEFAYLAELLGGGRVADGRRPALRHALGPVREGVSIYGDYCVRVWLPGVDARPLAEAAEGGVGYEAPVPDLAEQWWCAYAWPRSPKIGGAVLFINQDGQLLATPNANRRYAGLGRGPRPEAAYAWGARGIDRGTAVRAIDGRSVDGERWLPVHVGQRDLVLHVRRADGAVAGDVRVTVAPPQAARVFGDAEVARLRAHRDDIAALAQSGCRLPLASGVTGVDGSVRLRGAPVVDAVIVLTTRLGGVVPARIEMKDGALIAHLAADVADVAAARRDANEAAAIATLRNLASAQAQCRASGALDTDGDGKGEFGYLAEMAGSAQRHGRGGVLLQRISPPFLSAGFAAFDPEQPAAIGVQRSGYCFAVFLPDAFGLPLAEASAGGCGGVVPDAAAGARWWCAYAWPVSLDRSGGRTFFIDQEGDVLAADNARTRYSGWLRPPAPDAARAADGDGRLSSPSAVQAAAGAEAPGRDRQLWRPAF